MKDLRRRPSFSTLAVDSIFGKALPALLKTEPGRALRFMATQLNEAIDAEVPESLREYSSLWRSTISDVPEPFPKHNHVGLIVTLLRESLAKVITQKLLPVPVVRSELAGYQRSIFRRIEIDVLAQHFDLARDWAVDDLSKRSYFDNPDLVVEYWKLAKAAFPTLSPRRKQKLLHWISAEDGSSYEVDSPEWHRAVRQKRDRLWALEPFLQGDPAAELRRLIEAAGVPEDITTGNWPTAATFGPSSPIPPEIIASAPIPEIVEKLATWSPDSSADIFVGPSPEGAARQLKARAAAHPGDFTDHVDLLRTLEPTYLRGIVEGLGSALKNGLQLDWAGVIDLMRWIASQDDTQRYESIGFLGRDTDWKWARRAVASFLLDALTDKDRWPGIVMRDGIWSIVRVLCEDIDPETPDPERKNDHSSSYANQALNSVRGVAIRLVTEYARWVYVNTASEPEKPQADRNAFEIMPEVPAILDEHLDNTRDDNPIVRAVYGQQFGLLQALDSQWSAAAVTKIFGDDPYSSEQMTAAWDAFLVFSTPTLRAFRLLSAQYAAAARHLGRQEDVPEEYDDRQPYLQLAEHIFLNAIFDTETDATIDPLLNLIIKKGPPKIREHLMHYGARVVHDNTQPRALAQLQAYAESRIIAAQQAQSIETFAKEIASFGWWFLEPRLDQSWRFRHLDEVLDLTGSIEPAYQGLELLCDLTSEFPKDVITTVDLIVAKSEESWLIFGSQGSIREILETALQADPELGKQIKRIASRMVSRGWLEFSALA